MVDDKTFKAELSDFKISIIDENGNYKPLTKLDKVDVNILSDDSIKEYTPVGINNSFEIKIHSKKYGDTWQQYLYFKNHKKKRIRKKYDLARILGFPSKNNWY